MSTKQQLRVFARSFASSSRCRQKHPKKPILSTKDVTKAMDAPTRKEMWGLLSEIFTQTPNTPEVLARYHRRAQELRSEKIAKAKARVQDSEGLKGSKNSGLYVTGEKAAQFSLYRDLLEQDDKETKEEPSEDKPVGFAKNKLLLSLLDSPLKTSTTLYWPCGTLSFLPSDFKRILPSPESCFISQDSELDLTVDEYYQAQEFSVVRSRDPKMLVRWIGYYLEFPTREAAVAYYVATLGAELCGIRVNFRFVDPGQAQIHPPLLSAVPGVTRRMCALVAGLPPKYSAHSMARILWDYDLLPSAPDAIVKLSGDEEHSVQSCWLLRFINEDEPRRLVRAYNNRYWPRTTMVPSIEVLD